jgi:hypothetical protein
VPECASEHQSVGPVAVTWHSRGGAASETINLGLGLLLKHEGPTIVVAMHAKACL